MPAARVDKVPGHRGGATSLGRHAMMQGRRCRACERALDQPCACAPFLTPRSLRFPRRYFSWQPQHVRFSRTAYRKLNYTALLLVGCLLLFPAGSVIGFALGFYLTRDAWNDMARKVEADVATGYLILDGTSTPQRQRTEP